MILPSRSSRFLIAVLLGALPIVITFLVTTFYMHVNLIDSIPTGSDEIDYWQEINTFREVGFQNGYYTFNEIPASASFSRYGGHGPIFIAIMGVLARIIGWNYTTMILLNFLIIFISLFFLVYAIPWTQPQLLILCLFVGTYWALMLFLPLTMQETIQYTIALIAACIFYRQFASNDPLPRRFKIFALAFFVAAGIFRANWTFLVLPLLLLNNDNQTRGDYLRAVVISLILIGIPLGLFIYLSAPYPLNFSRALMRILARSPLEAIMVEVQYFILNIRRMRLGTPLEVIQRYEILFFLIILGTGFVATRRPQSALMQRLSRWFSLPSREIYFHWLNLGLIVFVQVTIYDVFDWRDYRVFAPNLMLSILLLIALNRLRISWAFIAVAILCFPFFLTTFDGIAHNMKGTLGTEKTSRYEVAPFMDDFIQKTSGLITYDAGANNAWCNTLLIKTHYPELLALPPGTGISLAIEPEAFKQQPKSRYLLFTDKEFAYLADYVNVQKLTDTRIGTLYLNLDADCD